MKNFLGVYWHGDRGIDTSASAANVILEYLERLMEFDPDSFGSWYITANSKEEAMKNKVQFSKEHIEKKLYVAYAKDILKPGEINPIMYYSFSPWSGHSNEEDAFHIGIMIGNDSLNTFNNCTINFPSSGPVAEKYAKKENYDALAKFLVGYWKPEKIMFSDMKMKPASL